MIMLKMTAKVIDLGSLDRDLITSLPLFNKCL